MKFLVASDIHGSYFWCQKFFEMTENFDYQKIILLGDLLNHGPRNQLPCYYEPAKTAELLNEHKDEIIACRGNCDSEVDQMLLDFPLMSDYILLIDDAGTEFFFTHGHIYNEENMPSLPEGSWFISGHTHVKLDEDNQGIRFVNPGSVALPKDWSNSFVYFNGHEFEFHTL